VLILRLKVSGKKSKFFWRQSGWQTLLSKQNLWKCVIVLCYTSKSVYASSGVVCELAIGWPLSDFHADIAFVDVCLFFEHLVYQMLNRENLVALFNISFATFVLSSSLSSEYLGENCDCVNHDRKLMIKQCV